MMLVRRIVLLLMACGLSCLASKMAAAQQVIGSGARQPADSARQAPLPGNTILDDAIPEDVTPDDVIPEELMLAHDGSFYDEDPVIDMEGSSGYGIASSGCCDDGSCGQCGGASNLVHSWLWNVRARGWVDQGLTFNSRSPEDRFNTPVTFNDRSNDYQLNQAYLILEREIDKFSDTWGLGGRVDLLWGSDYFFTESVGLEVRGDGTQRWNSNIGPRGVGAPLHGLALPQAYAEVFLPVWQGLSIKMGHFYSTTGYESVMAPDNFFYSHSYVMQYGEPQTLTGLIASFQASRGLVFHGGFHRGWNAWHGLNNELSFIGGVKLRSLDDRTTFAFTITHGHDDPDGRCARTLVSNVLRHELSPCTTYVVQFDYGSEEGASADGEAQWYGLTNYLYYRTSPTTEFGMRLEWFRDTDNARVLGISDGSADGQDYGEVTLGMNWRPCENLVVRPEVRWDMSNVVPPFGANGMYDGFTERNQFLAAVDMIWRF